MLKQKKANWYADSMPFVSYKMSSRKTNCYRTQGKMIQLIKIIWPLIFNGCCTK